MNKLMLKKQYLMYAPKKKGGLPSAYQEVEYIQSTGTQYIDTGVKATNTTKFKIYVEITEYGTYIFGAWNDWQVSMFTIYSDNAENSAIGYGANWVGGIKGITTNNKITLSIDNGVVKYNDEIKGTYSDTFNSANNIIICGTNAGGTPTAFSKIKIYSLEIDGHNYIPCYRKSDNEIGMYDIVNNQFYTNAGSGSFIYGREIINIDGYRQVEYIAGNNAYIEFPYVTNGLTVGFDISFYAPSMSLTQDTPIIQNDWLSNWVPLGMSLTNKNKTYFGSYSMADIPYWTNDTYTYNEDRYLINYKNSNVISSIGKSNWSHTLNKSLNDVAITYFTFMSVGVPSTFHLKSLDMTDGDNIVARFIPVEEVRTGNVGLYDLIGKKFYSSQTNSNFIKGDYI